MPNKKTQLLISEMENICEQLVQIAEELIDASSQTPSHEEIEGLQLKQKKLLLELQKKDKVYLKSMKNKNDASSKQSIQKRLNEFENLNQRFIENMRRTSGLIQFDPKHLPKNNR